MQISKININLSFHFCRIIYKIVYPEDVLPALPAAKPATPAKPAKRTALSGDTSDEDSYGECESPPQIHREMVIPI